MIRLGTAVAIAAALGLAAQAFAQNNAELVSHTELRVCADPHDLPFSNDQRQGFENKIADLIAADLKLPVADTWFPDSQGFVRATLLQNRCDVIMGTAVGDSDVTTTEPYYHTGYMLVTRSADHITTNNLGDPRLAGKRFGLVAGTPPTNLLVAHDLIDQAKIYPLVVDTRVDQSALAMLQDLVANRIDAALVWGPFAGYYINQMHLPLQAVFLDSTGSPIRLDYHIAMGVREADVDFRRLLNRSIGRHKAEIAQILQDFHIPLLDEQGKPVAPAAKSG